MKANLLAPNDNELLNDVLLQLESNLRISSRDIAVAVKRDIITLSGFVCSREEKSLVEDIVKGIYGVRGVANDLEVEDAERRTDTEIARDAVQALDKQADVPNDKIMVTVEDAWVRLQGFVDWKYQKQIAGSVVKNLKAVKGVVNNIEAKERVSEY